MTIEEFVKYRTGIQNGVINCLKLWVTDGDDFESKFGNEVTQRNLFICADLAIIVSWLLNPSPHILNVNNITIISRIYLLYLRHKFH